VGDPEPGLSSDSFISPAPPRLHVLFGTDLLGHSRSLPDYIFIIAPVLVFFLFATDSLIISPLLIKLLFELSLRIRLDVDDLTGLTDLADLTAYWKRSE
jgi:hypothetical protein